MTTIDELLAQRSAFRTGRASSVSRAKQRFDLSREIGEHYPAFNPIRLHLLRSRANRQPFEIRTRDQERLIHRLFESDYIVEQGRGLYRFRDSAAKSYLNGDWLEELAYFAILESGADEATFHQNIGWRVDEFDGACEIDVIARRGEILSLTSCKGARPVYEGRISEKLRSFVYEAGYWADHFADDTGRTVLMVTTDLVDEARNNAARYPGLFARATVLEVDIVSLDYFKWGDLIEKFRSHWDS